jgi:hypothetical protein
MLKEAIYGEGHLLLRRTDNQDIAGIPDETDGDSPFPDSKTVDKAEGRLRTSAALGDMGHLEDVFPR